MLYYEQKFKKKGRSVVIGIDEAGRGCLAGPVVAAAVCLRSANFKNRVDDSKRLTSLQREKAFFEIINKSIYGVGVMNEAVIDRLNILVATRLAMQRGVEELLRRLIYKESDIQLLVDGNVKLETGLAYTNIIKGDSKSLSIAAASILAKVIRDRIMYLYDKVFPQYGFVRHKGYPTKKHRIALERFGRSFIHRTSFYGV